MYRVVICDDEKAILPSLQKQIADAFAKCRIEADYMLLDDSRVLRDKLQEECMDILFVDIDMPCYSGMDIASYINAQDLNIILIFVTSHEMLVYKSFAYKPFAFVRKTHLSEDIGELSDRLPDELRGRRQELLLKRGGQMSRLRIRDIVYLESDGNYVRIVTQQGEIRHRETLSVMEKELSAQGFFRCHKGYLINPEYVMRYQPGMLQMRCGASGSVEVPIGRSYEKETKRKLIRSMI